MRTPHTVIIGGTTGLGLVLANRFGELNHRVSVIGRRAVTFPKALTISRWRVDLADSAALRATLRQVVTSAGEIDNLVFCQRYRAAGDDWQGEISVSLTAVKTAVEATHEHFNSRGGSIVVVGSIAGQLVASEQPVSYHVVKAALVQLIRYYAVQLGGARIRVNGVSPGTIVKEESRSMYARNHSLVALHRKIIPLRRAGSTGEVAQVVLFLCDAGSSYVTGQDLIVDGGLSIIWQESLARGVAGLRFHRRRKSTTPK